MAVTSSLNFFTQFSELFTNFKNPYQIIKLHSKNKNTKKEQIQVQYRQGPSITKKNENFFFVYFGTHNNKIHTIYKQIGVFVFFFHVVVLLLLANSNNKKIVILYTFLVCYAWP
jgi:hypothetical protein